MNEIVLKQSRWSRASQPVRLLLIALVIMLLGALLVAGAYFLGRHQGRLACTTISSQKVRESVEITNQASNKTARFAINQERTIAELQNQLKEVTDACANTPMPAAVIDILNQ